MDRRGVSQLIGFILLFAVAIVAFSTYQAFVVPDQNAGVESEHLDTITRQTQDLRNAVVSLPGTGSDRSVTITLGTTYPPRLVAVNPPQPSGTIRTVGTGAGTVNLTLANAVATGGETGDFWNGTDQSLPNGGVVYEPNYNEYENPPTIVYENTLLYKEFDSGNVSETGQRLVDGRRLTLIALNGSLDRGASSSLSIDVEAVSASETTIAITNETGEHVNISVATQRNVSAWEEVLAEDDQFVDDGGHVVSVSRAGSIDDRFDLVTITLEQNVTYDLRMAKAGLGTRVAEEDEAYLTDVSGDGRTLQQDETTDLTVAVRDRYNNPVSGVVVNASTDSGSIEDSATTGTDGEASFEYTAPSGTSGDVFANFSYRVDPATASPFDGGAPENVSMTVTVQSSGGAGGGGGGRFSVSWLNPDTTGDNSGASLSNCDGDDCDWDVGNSADDTLTLRGKTSPEIEDITLDFGVNDSAVGTVSPIDNTTDAGGEATTDLQAQDNGTVAVFVASGGTSDDINITLTGVGTGTSSASSTTVVTSSKTGGSNQKVKFTLENTGSSSVTIQNITVDSADSNDVKKIGNGSRGNGNSYDDDGPELRSNRTGDLLDTPNTFGLGSTQSLNSTSSISAGDRTEYTLAEFRKNNNDEVDPGSQVTITLGFDDGSEKTATLSL